MKARHGHIRGKPSRFELTHAVVGIFQLSQRILKDEKISNREADLRFELDPLQSGLKRVRNISRRDIRNTSRSECIQSTPSDVGGMCQLFERLVCA